MRRSAFSLLELTVTLCIAGMVMGGAYFSLSTGQGASQRGVVLLDELGKQIRLTEQLRRVLRTATAVVQTPRADGADYDVTYVSRIDEAGPTLVTERARLEVTTMPNGGLNAVFLREGQKALRYQFSDMLMDIDVGTGNATIRFTSRRASTSLQLACANLLPSGIPLDPVLRPGPLPTAPPLTPGAFSPMSNPMPQSAAQSGTGPTATSAPRTGVAPPLVKAATAGGASGGGSTPPSAPPLGPAAANGAGPVSGGTTTPPRTPQAMPPPGLAGETPGPAAGATPGTFGATPVDLASTGTGETGRTPSRPGLPPIRTGRPGDSVRKPPRVQPPVGWTGLDPKSPAGRSIAPTSAAAPARPPALKAGKPATPATAARPADERVRLPGDEVAPAAAAASVDQPF